MIEQRQFIEWHGWTVGGPGLVAFPHIRLDLVEAPPAHDGGAAVWLRVWPQATGTASDDFEYNDGYVIAVSRGVLLAASWITLWQSDDYLPAAEAPHTPSSVPLVGMSAALRCWFGSAAVIFKLDAHHFVLLKNSAHSVASNASISA